MESDFANRKLSDSLSLQVAQARDQILTVEHLLKDALNVNHRDSHAHFELGWIYLCLLEAPELAEFHLACAARLAREEGQADFMTFALRHLADACYRQDKHEEAARIALEVLRSAPQADHEHLYECARYLAAAGEVETATRRLAALVAQSPLHYVQAQTEPDFCRHDGIRHMLHDLRQLQVDRIRHCVQLSWRNHQLSRLPLPDRIDSEQLFRQTFQRHVRVMQHLPYGALNRREQQIGQLVVSDSQRRILQEIRQRSRGYEQVSERKRQRWSWINTLGGMCLHASIVLLLACVMFFAARYLADWLGFGALLAADGLLNYVVSVMLVLLAVGTALVQFVPLGSKKLLRKRIELDNTLKLLEAP
ncbi:MAG: hypothetical protein R3E89_00410 [Thiolinea sp.]